MISYKEHDAKARLPITTLSPEESLAEKVLSLTVASISVTRVTKGSKLMISTTRWGRRSKIVLKTPPEVSRRIFWCNQYF